MGFFDRLTGRKPRPEPAPAPAASTPTAIPEAGAQPEPAAATPGPTAGTRVKTQLAAAREKLDHKDLTGALSLYEEVLASAGDRPDVLVTISGDLGSHGHVAEIIELVAPRYDAERHGPATGINLLQAYLALRNADAAQHVLDILFSLKRPELEDRLYGFSNAIAELLGQATSAAESTAVPVTASKVGLITLSKPVWFYGLESLSDQILPPKSGKLRRIAFAQLALPGLADVRDAMERPDDELTRLARAIPLWFAESFTFSPHYAPIAAVGIFTPPDKPTRHVIFGSEWTMENLRQLVETSHGGLDYIVTGALRASSGDYEVVLRLHEVRSFRERKKFTARWTPATADAELQKLDAEVRRFMEWSSVTTPLAYTPPASPARWLATLGASESLFVVEKGIADQRFLAPLAPDIDGAAQQANENERAALAYLTLLQRARKTGFTETPTDVTLPDSTLIAAAQQALV